MMKRVLLWSMLFFSVVSFSAPIQSEIKENTEATRIMYEEYNRSVGVNRRSDMTMIMVNERGHKRTLELLMYETQDDKARSKLLFFQYPNNVKDTAFLVYDYHEQEKITDQWIYVPGLNKTKRIATKDRSNRFMGSDFNYADMVRRPVTDYNYTLLKEIDVNKEPVWVIQAIPKSEEEAKATNYKKSVYFISKKSFLIVRAVHWVRNSRELKQMQVKKSELIDNIWVASEIKMSTKKGKKLLHSTTISFSNTKFKQTFQDDFFTTRQMSKGSKH